MLFNFEELKVNADISKMDQFKLTQFSHGAGCGCKISPGILEEILKSNHQYHNKNLIVGSSTKDDAAVYDIGGGQAIISTTDFFMPIVDDPATFGQIASVNAISDVYAMGGKPILAIAILGWPVDKLPPSVAKEVLEGSRQVCERAGIPLAGGHSIDCPEPVFGLAVTGISPIDHIKRNDTAKDGDLLYLTKPLGVGIITTAQKKGLVREEDLSQAIKQMVTLNNFGEHISHLSYIHAVTDVTGFGLLGHLKEMCEGSNLSATVNFEDIPVLDCVYDYLKKGCVPGGTSRNWESYKERISNLSDTVRNILCDPQTSGGLLISVSSDHKTEFEMYAKGMGMNLKSFGSLQASQKSLIQVDHKF